MEADRIFSAEQIKVHPDLSKIIREYTKAVIRANPQDIVLFSSQYFSEKVEAAESEKEASDK
jgi:Regulatory subunit of type II PKA R-subunit